MGARRGRADPDDGSRPAPPGGRITYVPTLPDGEDCPWVRERATRWWLVVPADLLAVALVAVFGAASQRAGGQAPAWVLQGVASLVPGWLAAWALRRRGGDHLELAWPDGALVVGVTALTWTVLHVLIDGLTKLGAWAAVTAVFLMVFLGGWRWLYGFVRAHDSLTPRGVARRIAAQDAEAGEPRAAR